MNFVSPAKLNDLRFPHDPVPLPKLWRWCRTGKLPARKIGGEWYVDLDAFDRGLGKPSSAVLDKLRTMR
jgi:hypothetical protein